MGSRVFGVRAAAVAGVAAAAAITAGPAGAATGTFSNPDPITIPEGAPATTEGPSTPYPSNIDVAGLGGTVTDVNATIHDFSHTFSPDINVLLAGPGGQAVVLMRRAGDADDANITLTFDDEAAAQLPMGPLTTGPLISGSFKPSGPPTLAVFDGTTGAGRYSLFVDDDVGGDTGSIAGGWSIELTTLETLITGGPKPKTRKRRAEIEFTSDQPGSTFQCALDEGAFAACASPHAVRVGKGEHTLEVRATNPEGVTDATPATHEWRVKKRKK
jgi:subtilisin-like proprotein convertase family protein